MKRALIFSAMLLLFLSLPALRAKSIGRSTFRPRTVRVKFEVGIYREWDHSWMTTAPEDVIVTLMTSKGTLQHHPQSRKGIVFDGVPCGERIKINLKFIGTGTYKRTSRDYERFIGCNRAVVSLGKLEYGTW